MFISLNCTLAFVVNHRWLLDERMLEGRHKQNANYDSTMTEIIYSTYLSEDELDSYYPKQVKLVGNISAEVG